MEDTKIVLKTYALTKLTYKLKQKAGFEAKVVYLFFKSHKSVNNSNQGKKKP